MYMTAAGMAMSELSNLSSIPPCPGRMLPESFIPSLRLRRDSVRSPHVPNITTIIASPPHAIALTASLP